MKKARFMRFGKRPAVLFTAVIGAAFTLFASGFFAIRAFAAGPSSDNDYVVQYSLAEGETLVRGDAASYGDGTYGGKPATKGEISGNNISLKTTAAKEHYAFRGWRVSNPDGSNASDYTTSPYNAYFNPVKIKVKFIWVKTYRYTYDRNLPDDATVTGHIPVDQYKNGNEEGTADIPLPGLVGEPGKATMADGKTRVFKGWSLSDDNDQSKIITGLTESEFGSDFDLISQGVNGDRVSEYHFTRKLYAVWQDNVSIFYDGNGGKMQLNTKEHVTENSADASGFVDHPLIDSCKREYYTFKGWNTTADGKGTHYEPGQLVTLTEDLYLFAEWEYCPQYTVYFHDNNPRAGATVNGVPESKVISTITYDERKPPFNADGEWTISPAVPDGQNVSTSVYVKETRMKYVDGDGNEVFHSGQQATFLLAGWTKNQGYAPDAFADKNGARTDHLTAPNHSSPYLLTTLTEDDFSKDSNGDCYVDLYAYWTERATVICDANGYRLDSVAVRDCHYPGADRYTALTSLPSHKNTFENRYNYKYLEPV